MHRNICSFTACLLLTVFSYSQNQGFSRKELGDLDLRIQNFISRQDSIFSEGRRSEFVQLIIETDSSGAIRGIRSAGTDTDSLYKIIKKMTPQYFADWKGPKNKNIIIPYFYLSNNSNNNKNYVDSVFLDYYRKIPGKIIVSDSGNTIVYKWLMYFTPLRSSKEENRVNKTVF